MGQSLAYEWLLHYGAHCHWRDQVYSDFKVNSINEVLNIEPSIDHTDYHNATIPDYFHKKEYYGVTLTWIDANFKYLEAGVQQQALTMACEAAAILAAHAMCHPRARVGHFDWSDVVRLHEVLQSTGYLAFLKKI